MSVEWHYQDAGKIHGPVTDRVLSELAGQGRVLPSTPVRRTAGDRVTGWRRAGAVRGLFSGDVTSQIGDPICENCGSLLVRGNECPVCLPPPSSIFSTPVAPVVKAPRQLVVTTGDLRESYDVIGPVFFHASNKRASFDLQGLVKKHMTAIAVQRSRGHHPKVDWGFQIGEWSTGQGELDKLFFVGVQELKERAAMLGADAVIGMRQDIDFDATSGQHFSLQIYGTAVKMR